MTAHELFRRLSSGRVADRSSHFCVLRYAVARARVKVAMFMRSSRLHEHRRCELIPCLGLVRRHRLVSDDEMLVAEMRFDS